MGKVMSKKGVLESKNNYTGRLASTWTQEAYDHRALLLRTVQVASQTESKEQTVVEDLTKLKHDMDNNDLEEYSKKIITNSPVILPVLFSKMDFETLKNARIVCHKWQQESISEFFKRIKTVLNIDSCSSIKKLNISITAKPPIFTVQYVQELRTKNIGTFIYGRYFQTVLTELITSLSFVFADKERFNIKAEQIALIVQKCYNVSDLHFKNIPKLTALQLELYNRLALKRIRSLRLTACLDERRHYWEFRFDWFVRLPTLERIELNVNAEAYAGERLLRTFYLNLAHRSQKNKIKEITLRSQNPRPISMDLHSLKNLRLIDLKCLEIGYMEEWESDSANSSDTFHCNYHSGRGQYYLLSLMIKYKESLEVLRISAVDTFIDITSSEHINLPIMKKLKILEIDWLLLSTHLTNFDSLPEWEHCKFIHPKCAYRQENYFNKAQLKVKSTENDGITSDNVLRTLECLSPEVLTQIMTSLLNSKTWPVRVMTVDLRYTSHDTLATFLFEIATTNIEEIYLSIGCNINSDDNNYRCCDILTTEEYVDFDKKHFQSLWCAFNPKDEDQVSCETQNSIGYYQKLRQFELTSFGCRKINVTFLRNAGIFQRLNSSPVCENVTLKYRLMFQSREITKTCRIFPTPNSIETGSPRKIRLKRLEFGNWEFGISTR